MRKLSALAISRGRRRVAELEEVGFFSGGPLEGRRGWTWVEACLAKVVFVLRAAQRSDDSIVVD
jgi:hypothetical protein